MPGPCWACRWTLIMISPGAAAVWYSAPSSVVEGRPPDPARVLADVLDVPESDVRIFGHHEGAAQRRLGPALATASDVTTARDRVRRASTAPRKLWHP